MTAKYWSYQRRLLLTLLKRHRLNYLAHIHLGHLSHTSLVGNFLGDFVKGGDLSYLSSSHRQGVWLHRRVDSFTDQHSTIIELRRHFPGTLRRFSGIALDVYFDHLLCQHWERFSSEPIDTVLNQFYQQLKQTDLAESKRFADVKQRLLKYRWLNNYASRESVDGTLKSIERRFSRPIVFSEQASRFLQYNHSLIEDRFMSFYPQLIQYAKKVKNNYVD